MSRQKLGSIVVPCYNEEANILEFHEAVTSAIKKMQMPFEIVFVDDGSTDSTFEMIWSLAEKDSRVKCLQLSRNFGSHSAILAGLHSATGDFAVMISADLQDPPEVIPEMVARWEEGYHVVWAVREGRDDPVLKKLLAGCFYWLLRRIALPDYPAKGMDYGLFDRRVLDALKGFTEVNQFLTGSIVWLGFRQTEIPYLRQARTRGVSKWPVGKRIKTALDAIVSFSYFPVRFISYSGMAICLLSFLYAVFLVFRKVFLGLGGAGWPSLMVAVLFLGGTQLIMVGILGEYLWRGVDHARKRPPYIVMERIGFDK